MADAPAGPGRAIGPGGGLRAASSVPRGVEEAVILDIEAGIELSETVRGGEATRLIEGFAGGGGGEATSSGEVGGEGESRGLSLSSWEPVMVVVFNTMGTTAL